jgi:hypothetical protein
MKMIVPMTRKERIKARRTLSFSKREAPIPMSVLIRVM